METPLLVAVLVVLSVLTYRRYRKPVYHDLTKTATLAQRAESRQPQGELLPSRPLTEGPPRPRPPAKRRITEEVFSWKRK